MWTRLDHALPLALLGATVVQAAALFVAMPGAAAVLHDGHGVGVEWVKFEDLAERAFTLEVPQGWRVKGRLFRLGYSDERVMVDITSPDARVNIRLGDVSVRSYEIPVRPDTQEGHVDDLGAQVQLLIARYRTGPEFVVAYSHARFFRICQNPAPDPDDVDFVMQDYLPADVATKQTSTGQIAYRCNTKQGVEIAFAYVRTSLYGQLWQVPALISFMAPPDKVIMARNIALHCARSFHLNAAWIEYQKQMDAQGLQYQRARQQQRLDQMSQQVQRFEAKMRSTQNQVEAFRRQQNGRSEQVESFTQALRGVTPTVDPMAGEAREVWTSPKIQYWVNGLGDVVNSNSRPSPSWHQLQTNPPN